MSQYLVGEIEQNSTITVHTESEVSGGGGDGWLDHVVVRDRSTGEEERVDADGLFVMIGAEPRTDWLPERVHRNKGFVVCGTDAMGPQGWPLERPPMPYETTLPGFFAVGDVRDGSVKRVASAVGEGSVVVSQLHQYLAQARAAGAGP
jgi:thioredoxin reductase (NADPH)